jgi:hypothetical protein
MAVSLGRGEQAQLGAGLWALTPDHGSGADRAGRAVAVEQPG